MAASETESAQAPAVPHEASAAEFHWASPVTVTEAEL